MSEKTVLITGASAGFGEACARIFAAEGAAATAEALAAGAAFAGAGADAAPDCSPPPSRTIGAASVKVLPHHGMEGAKERGRPMADQ